MMSSAACLAKADQLDLLARECASPSGRDAYAQLAESWRRNARETVALEQLKASAP
jgi:hypothetical protein